MAGKVNWYGDRVSLVIKDASRVMVDKAAFLVEGQAKVNIVGNGQVDTGFMLNSVYAVTPVNNSYGQAQSTNVNGEQIAPQAPAPEDGAIVAVGARYALFQELKRSFLFKALEEVAGQMEGEIVQAGKAVVG